MPFVFKRNADKNRPKSPINGTSRKIDFACILPIDLVISLITYNTVAALEILLTNPLWLMEIESLTD